MIGSRVGRTKTNAGRSTKQTINQSITCRFARIHETRVDIIVEASPPSIILLTSLDNHTLHILIPPKGPPDRRLHEEEIREKLFMHLSQTEAILILEVRRRWRIRGLRRRRRLLRAGLLRACRSGEEVVQVLGEFGLELGLERLPFDAG